MRKAEAVAALREQRSATLAQLAGLDEPAWERPCLGSWRVREVVAHLLAIDTAAVTGRLLPLLRSARGRADVERWNDRAVSSSDAQAPEVLLAELERAGERLLAVAQRLPAAVWKLPIRTVFGRHPLAFLAARRVVDEWVHTVDIARASGSGAVATPCPDVLARGVLDALPALSLPEVPEGVGVIRLVVGTDQRVELEEHTSRVTWSVDLARRHYGERVTATPDATVRLHAAALALLVEGRTPEGFGAMEVSGDEQLAASLLGALSST
jgi:uncharacterized protein (TIGR03083 family)